MEAPAMRPIVLILTLLSCAAASAVTIENPGFDGAAREMPHGWAAEGAATGVFAVNDADGVRGTTCLQYRSQEALGETWVEQKIRLAPQTEYVLSAWLKSDGNTRPLVAVMQPGERDLTARVESDGAREWTQHRVRFNSGPLQQAVLRVYGDFGPGRASRAGEARIDDIRLTLAAEAAPEGPPIAGGYYGPPPGENIALGKSYEWSTAPTYSLTMDEGDSVQLTDGEYTVGYFWAQKSTVGWTARDVLELTFDLEQVEPIAGLSFNTAAGTAGVGWPTMIFILTSDDGESFSYHGELVSLSAEHGLPAPMRYVVHRYFTDRLQASGRYLRLVIAPGSQYLFSDEVEIFRGDFDLADALPGEPVESTGQLVESFRLDAIVGVRLLYDIQDLRGRIARADVPDALRRDLNARLDALAGEVSDLRVERIEHWRGLPYNELHERIYAVNALLLRAQGHDELTIWPARRWDMLDPMAAPEPGGEPRLSVLAMGGEYRSAAFNMTNLRDSQALARITVDLPGLDPDTITVHEVQYVQTQEREVTSNALPEARLDDRGVARIVIPAGLTKQAWLTVNPQGQPAGTHTGRITVEMPGATFHLPLTIEIAPFAMPRPPVSVYCWDYVGDRVGYAPGFTDQEAMARDLDEHFVDAPWAHPGTLPWPPDGGINADGHITGELDFGPLDRWIDRFPNARLYLMFANMSSGNFRGTTLGTERWAVALGEWATLLTEHLRGRGVPPERWAILIYDEPSTEAAEQIIVDVARALKTTEPELQVFNDPVRTDPTLAVPEMYEVSDILCPHLGRITTGGEGAIRFYQELQEQGKQFHIYRCSGPHKLLDPITYHRNQFWHAWNLGATGSGYWGYVDSNRTGSSWDNFRAGGTSFSMVYADDRNRLATSKQWEAVREGAQDYTILWMLREAIQAHEGAETGAIRHARELLETLPPVMAGDAGSAGIGWTADRDRSSTDGAREQLLRALIEIGPPR
jgi:hypothetical protein